MSAGATGYFLQACPKCQAAYKIRKDRADHKVTCRSCGHRWVPAEAAKAPAEPKPPEAVPTAAPAEPEAETVAARAPLPLARKYEEEEEDPLVGRTLDGFKVQSRIGSGGFGVVYRVFDTNLERSVAIKMLPPALARKGSHLVERFLREARSAAKLAHPNIVTIYQICPYKDTFYVVMELVDGGALHEFLAVQKRFRPAEATRVVRAAAEALGHAHRRGIIHRDIKPGNIMMTNDGQVKVTDFGLALDVLQAKDIVGPGHSLGTPRYMAPEQAVGEESTAASDLYSLAATYYALLTGMVPFEARTEREMMKRHVSAPVPDPRRYVPALPISVYRFLQKAMAKLPEDRYQTAEEFIEALDRIDFAADESAMATPETVSAQIGEIALEDRGSHLSEALGRAVRHAQRRRTPLARRALEVGEDATRPGRLVGWRMWLLIGIGAALLIAGAVVAAVFLAPRQEQEAPGPGEEAVAPAEPPAAPLEEPAGPPPPEPPSEPKPKPKPEPETPDAQPEANAREQLEAAKKFEKDPEAWVGDVINAYKAVIEYYPGTKAAEEAQQALVRLEKGITPKTRSEEETPSRE